MSPPGTHPAPAFSKPPVAAAHGRRARLGAWTVALVAGLVLAALVEPHPSWGLLVLPAALLSGIGASWSP
ncbi:hypothetical protein [Kineococcus auxinigenes]|uniref:hypothetical protein n=1 Tax=unclassified Kineococcus TaxID=2621656 RepID=UPI003D7D84D5